MSAPVKIRAYAQFDGWRAFMVGVCLDWRVVRTGDEGIEHAVELDIGVAFWSVGVSFYRVATPYRTDEHFLDALLRHQDGVA